MMIGKKKIILLIICITFSLTPGFLWAPAEAGYTVTGVISGQVPFINYNVSASDIGSNTANITWMTNGNSNSIVELGSSASSYGSPKTNGTLDYSHLVQLDGLSQFTTYHYRITSKMSDGSSTTSSDATFKTTRPTGTTVESKPADTTVSGVTTATTSSGGQQVNISTTAQSSATKTANTVTITNPATGWDSMKYTGTDVVTDPSTNTYSVNNLQSVVMTTTPVTADLGGNIGTASAQIDVALTKPVSGVTVQQNIIQGATTSTANAFQVAATSGNLNIKSVAYTVEFTNTANLNTNLGSAGVTLDLGVSHDWVVANGGTGSITIFRFGDDGTKEVLTTTYDRSSGSTDYFKARSPHGLSTFGMTATSSTSSDGGGGGNNGGGTSTGGVSDGGSDSGPVSRSSPVEQAIGPFIQEINKFLAPFQEAGITNQPVSITGLTVAPGPAGMQKIRLATALTEKSGATVFVTNNLITISQPGFTLIMETRDTPVNEYGEITGTIKSIGLHTTPVSASLSTGTVAFSLDTPLAAVPENAAITTTISETTNPDMLKAYQSAALNNKQVGDVAYSVVVEKTALATTGPAKVMLTISPDWVMTHGGTKSIGIAHIADDGTAELLATDYSGIDKDGNIIFQATSPKGLSTFSLVSLKDQTVAAQAPATVPASTVPASRQQSPGGIQNIAGVAGKFVADNLILIVGIFAIMLALGAGIIIYDRKSGTGKRLKKKE
nr:fibronectin type III domain-containing protein [uncultured Methanoregula sp.]